MEDKVHFIIATAFLMNFNLYRHWESAATANVIIPCKNESMPTNYGHFNWHWTMQSNGSFVISKPDLCWTNGHVVLRQCNTTNGVWMPETVECKTWQDDNNDNSNNNNFKCPDDLIEVKWRGRAMCLKISEKPRTYNEHDCYGSDYVLRPRDLTDRNLREIFQARNITQFWLPVNFYGNKSFNPVVIRLPGRYWNDLYTDGNFMSSTFLSGPSCFIATLQEEDLIRSVPCNRTFHSICLFRERLVTISGCPEHFGALSYRPNECFGILSKNDKPDQFHELTIKEYLEKRGTIWTIFNKRRFRIRRYLKLAGSGDSFEQPILAGNLSWALDRNGVPQILPIYQIDKAPELLAVNVTRERKNVELQLSIKENELYLIIYQINYLWSNEDNYLMGIYCYTTNRYGELSRVRLRKVWSSDFRDRMIYKYKLRTYDPSLYWCEGHSIFDFELITSNKIVASRAGNVRYNFLVHLNYHFKNTTSKFYTLNRKKQSNNIRTDIKALLRNCRDQKCRSTQIHNVRIVDIIDLGSNNMQYKCHLTVSNRNHSVHKESTNRGDSYEAKNLYNVLERVIKMWQPQQIETLRSTRFCFGDALWHTTPVGQLSTPSRFCLERNGLPPVRKCLGNFLVGAFWSETSHSNGKCFTDMDSNRITRKLYNIDTRKSTEILENDLIYIRELLRSNLLNLIPADLYYLSNIMKFALNTLINNQEEKVEKDEKDRLRIIATILQIQNDLLKAEERVFTSSALLNSTNVLLNVFETIIDEIFVEISARDWSIFNQFNDIQNSIKNNDDDDDIINITAHHEMGVLVYTAWNFAAFILDPQTINITGVALYLNDCNNTSEGLLASSLPGECYRYLTMNQSIEELIEDRNIMLATYVPEALWQRLDEIALMANRTDVLNNEPRIVIKIYGNDKLFQEKFDQPSIRIRKMAGKIISISIPGHDENLPGLLPILFNIPPKDPDGLEDTANNSSHYNEHHACSYWNYNEWSTDGVVLMDKWNFNNTMVICGSTHLTPFAYLIGTRYRLSSEFLIHQKALDIITILGCCLSLLGIGGLFITACIFRSWRHKANSIVLLQLSTAITFEMVLLCFVNTEANIEQLISTSSYTGCIVIGALLHYFVLVQFVWMLIIAYLQFKRYVQVFGNTRPKRFFIKSTIIGWCSPLLPVILCLTVDSDSYIPQNYDGSDANSICYPTGYSLYYGILLPITTIVLINLIIFLIIAYNLIRNPIGSTRHFQQKSLIVSQLRLYMLLFFLLGFSWIFGFMAATNAGLIFSYLFCLTATLQGLVLFIYFILMDPVTRQMWWKYLRILCNMHDSTAMMDASTSTKKTTPSFSG